MPPPSLLAVILFPAPMPPPSLFEVAIFSVALATLPTVLILRKHEHCRQTGIVLAVGGGLALALSLAYVLWSLTGNAGSPAQAWTTVVTNDFWALRCSWRIIFGATLLGMLASWLSLVFVGPHLLRTSQPARKSNA